MELLGYFFAICIGITLGIIGGGGSILTIPVLVYFFKVDPVLAGGYSLFVVGASSLIGVTPKFRQHLVNVKTAIIFGVPSLITVFLTRLYLLPAIPEQLFSINDVIIGRSGLMMILFALLMLAASRSMIVISEPDSCSNDMKSPNNFMLAVQGAIIGIVTGLLGAGGGFLIIPALIMLSKLPMKEAVGTSLLIIAVNSIIGFLGNWSVTGESTNWLLLASITALAIVGILIGNRFGAKIDGNKLKRAFGWFILIMGSGIIFIEILHFLY